MAYTSLETEKLEYSFLQTMKTIQGTKQITLLGKFLRISKIDELPQLISVLKNDMSLIGPRPLYIDFNQHYKEKHRIRLFIKPGLTGLAQIKGIDMSIPENLAKIDAFMISNLNHKNYFKYLLLTLYGKGFGDKTKK